MRSGGGRILLISLPGGPFKLSLIWPTRKADNSLLSDLALLQTPSNIEPQHTLQQPPLAPPSPPPQHPPQHPVSIPHTHSSHTAHTRHTHSSTSPYLCGGGFSCLWSGASRPQFGDPPPVQSLLGQIAGLDLHLHVMRCGLLDLELMGLRCIYFCIAHLALLC